MVNIVGGIIILLLVVVSAMGFLMITNEYNIQYDKVIQDPINSTGIMVNNTTGYEAAKLMSTSISDNLIIGIFLSILLIVILILAYYKVIT